MQIQFDATLDELVEVTLRSLKRDPALTARKRRDGLIASLGGGLILFAIVPAELPAKIIFGALTALIIAVLYWVGFERMIARNVRTFAQRKLGASKTFPVTVELSDAGITFEQLGSRRTHPWSSVQDIQTTNDRVDILFDKGHIATVRARAFASSEQQKEFLDTANRYRAQTNQGK